MIFRLAILNGDRKGQQVTVPADAMTIGRKPDCELCLSDPEVATEHAVIEHTAQGLRIRDLGSMGKVLVNNRAVRESSLRHGDVLELGHTRLLVQAVVEAEVQGSELPPSPPHRFRGKLAVTATGMLVAAFVIWRAARSPGPEIRLPASEGQPASNAPAKPPAKAPAPVYEPDTDTGQPAGETLAEPADVAPIGVTVVQNPTVPPPTTTAPAPEPAPASAPPPLVVEEPHPDAYALAQAMLDSKVQGMMADAHLLVASNRPAEADDILKGVQVIAPKFVDAYAERAWLFEDRGMLDPAMAQWQAVARLGGNDSLVKTARAKLASLARAKQVVVPKFGGRVHVQAMDEKRFPEAADVNEMRVISVTLAAADPMQPPDARTVRVDVIFYDRDLRTGSIRVTQATGRSRDLTIDGAWQPGELKTVTATYVVPAALAPAGTRAEQFYGYTVRVYRYGALQDESAQPLALLARLEPPGGGAPESVAASGTGRRESHDP